MKLLALETSTDACSAAIYLEQRIYQRYQFAPRKHARLLLPMVNEVLAEAGVGLSQLDAVAFGRGPGSFTGVRIGTSTAQALAFGAGLPVVPVSSLRALAQTAFSEHGMRRFAAAFDARMGEVYFGTFEVDSDGIAQPLGEERVCPPEEVPLIDGGTWSGVGPGWQAYASQLRHRLGERIVHSYTDIYPRARDVAVLGAEDFRRGAAVSAEAALPVYLRDRVTQR